MWTIVLVTWEVLENKRKRHQFALKGRFFQRDMVLAEPKRWHIIVCHFTNEWIRSWNCFFEKIISDQSHDCLKTFWLGQFHCHMLGTWTLLTFTIFCGVDFLISINNIGDSRNWMSCVSTAQSSKPQTRKHSASAGSTTPGTLEQHYRFLLLYFMLDRFISCHGRFTSIWWHYQPTESQPSFSFDKAIHEHNWRISS